MIGGRCITEKKRLCKPEDISDSEPSTTPFWETDEFLAGTMRLLIDDANFSVSDYFEDLEKEGHTEKDLATNIHDAIVGKGDGPRELEEVL